MLRSFCSLVFPRPLCCLMALEILMCPPPTFMVFLRVLPSVITCTFTTCVFVRSSTPLHRLASPLNHPSFLLMEHVQYVGHVLCNGKRFPSLAKYEVLREWKREQITTAKA